jgi:glycosyltransferase involved in cell wall biosynthesis
VLSVNLLPLRNKITPLCRAKINLIVCKIKMRKSRLLFIGAFPGANRQVFGGNITDCRVLIESSLPERVDLVLLDSTQISNPAPNFLIRLLLAFRRLIVFAYRFELKKPDAVLIFTGSGAGLLEKGIMARYAKLRKIHAFIFPRGGGLLTSYAVKKSAPQWVKFSFAGAYKILCQGTAMQDYAISALGRTNDETVIVPNWTATTSLLSIGEKRLNDNALVGGGAERVRLLFVGWLEKAKGVEELLNAYHDLSRKHNASLDIVGDGNAREWVEEFINHHELKTSIRLCGWLSGDALEKAYQSADVFILPSWVEGLPNAIIEAMAAGLCIVSSCVGNIPDIIKSGRNGILVSAKNVEELSCALNLVAENLPMRKQLGRAAYNDAKKSFRSEQAVNKLIETIFPTQKT